MQYELLLLSASRSPRSAALLAAGDALWKTFDQEQTPQQLEASALLGIRHGKVLAKEAARAVAGDCPTDHSDVFCLQAGTDRRGVVSLLHRTADTVAAAPCSTDSERQLAHHIAEHRDAIISATNGLHQAFSPGQVVEQLQAVVHHTVQLGHALLAWWNRPEAQPEQQLELAQAAAARSCAYLRCGNLGGEGGPAAGQGVGSMRCRWVDWRGAAD